MIEDKTPEQRKELDQQLIWADSTVATEDQPPAWFGTDEEATASSMAMARMLGLTVSMD